MIVHGRVPPGARIAEGPLAEVLGVSRTPVREALQRLREEGLLIEVGGGCGLRGRLAVAPLQRERTEERYAPAAAMEGLAERAWSKVAAATRQARAQRLETSARTEHAEARARLRPIQPQMDRYEWFDAPMAGPDFTPTRREHAAIVEAVRHGTAHELERAVRANWLNAAQRLGPLIEHFDGRLPAGAPITRKLNAPLPNS